ncbi:MAG: response regulator [Deltaproteobacteria bacterium]|nr:response regulator [Deltaproteobacteria bacterium]
MAPAQESPPRVLVVDDEQVIRRLVERYCAGLGADVCVAASAAEAEALVEARPVDAAVIDKNMPGVSGMDLLRSLRRRFPRLVAVIMTADPTDVSRFEAEKLGAAAYLAKPFALSQLDSALRKALHRAFDDETDSGATVRRPRALTSLLRDMNARFDEKK